jgi:cytochrome c553
MKLVRAAALNVGIFISSLALFVATHRDANAQGDVNAGREKAQKCEACHGLDGLSKIAEAPNLAGQNEQYLIEQLNAFKTAERKNEMMSLVAPTLSPKDIEDLAIYYSAIEITIKKLP